MDNTFFKMKESKLIELKNKVDRLSKIIPMLINEIQANATLAQGTLTAFQLHIGEDKWKELVKQLKDLENKNVEQQLEKGD